MESCSDSPQQFQGPLWGLRFLGLPRHATNPCNQATHPSATTRRGNQPTHTTNPPTHQPPPGFACPMNMENIAATSPGARHCATRCQTEMHSFCPRSVRLLNLHKVWPETLRLLTADASVAIAPFDRPPRVLAHLPMARRHTDLCLSLDLPCRNDLCENLHLPMHPAKIANFQKASPAYITTAGLAL